MGCEWPTTRQFLIEFTLRVRQHAVACNMSERYERGKQRLLPLAGFAYYSHNTCAYSHMSSAGSDSLCGCYSTRLNRDNEHHYHYRAAVDAAASDDDVAQECAAA